MLAITLTALALAALHFHRTAKRNHEHQLAVTRLECVANFYELYTAEQLARAARDAERLNEWELASTLWELAAVSESCLPRAQDYWIESQWAKAMEV